MSNIRIMLENHRLPKPEMHSAVITEFSAKEISRETVFRVSEHTVSLDTISCILQYGRGKTIALNFANANFPGGAYLLGGNAQEEALCRASLLYYTISRTHGYYSRNRLHVLPDYTDTMIYSEAVPVVRDNNGQLLDTPVLCDFITSPAVNRTFAKFMFPKKYLNAVMEQRIQKIIMLAASRQPDVLVLGAYGCGVFGNRREDVFAAFEAAINRYLPDSVEILFALPDK